IVSDEAPALFEVFLKVGQSAASSETTATRQHTASNSSLRVKLRSNAGFIKSLFIGSRCQIRRKKLTFLAEKPGVCNTEHINLPGSAFFSCRVKSNALPPCRLKVWTTWYLDNPEVGTIGIISVTGR